MLQFRYEEQGVAKTYRLKPGLTQIGRLPSSDLILLDPSVSRHHASVRVFDGECRLQDAGSRFGTFLNGQPVREEVTVPPGATIRLGEVSLTLEQHVAEQDLLTEDHEISDGPGTILRPIAVVPPGAGDGHLIRLLADVNRTLLSSQSLTDVLNKVVDLAFAAVPAERAFLMLRESADEALAARVLRHRDGSVPPNPTLSRMVVRRVMRERVAMLAVDATTDPGLGMTDSILRFNIRSFMCAPLWSREDVIGVLYVDSPRSAQFGPADLDAFTALANAAAVAIEQARLSAQLLEETRRRERLQRYHSPAVVSRILHGAEGESESGTTAHERDVTVMFCDLVGFTTLCEQIPASQSAALLNAFLTRMTDVVFEYEGTLDKFIGDALLAVFGAPFDQPQHPLKAVQAALTMRRALAEMNAKADGPKLGMRIAINTGTALTGDIGSPKRREFTVLGDVVNTAARIESQVAGPGEIVISGSTYARLGGHVTVRSLGSRQLRGRAMPLDLYAVEDEAAPPPQN
jgi:adenylate cyclase